MQTLKGVVFLSLIIPVNARNFIDNEVPKKTRARITPLLHNAYALAEQATKDSEFLNWVIGYKNIGYLKRIAVEYMLKDAIDNGRLPFEYQIVPNKNKSAWHLEIITKNAIITTSQVQSREALPNPAYFRRKLQEANQLRFSLDPENKDINEGPYHLLITHGYGTEIPSFINLGFPGATGWVDYINMLNEPILVESDSDREVDTKERLVGFKDFTKEVTNNGK